MRAIAEVIGLGRRPVPRLTRRRLTITVSIENADDNEMLHQSARTISAGSTANDITNAVDDCARIAQMQYLSGERPVRRGDDTAMKARQLRATVPAPPNVAQSRAAFLDALEGKLQADMGDNIGTALSAVATRLCKRCAGTGDTNKDIHDRMWDICPDCEGEGTVPRARG